MNSQKNLVFFKYKTLHHTEYMAQVFVFFPVTWGEETDSSNYHNNCNACLAALAEASWYDKAANTCFFKHETR